MNEKRINWEENFEDYNVVEAYNKDSELLGNLVYERVGRHMHWCWYQENLIKMSPGCLQEVRDKQKELLKHKRTTKNRLLEPEKKNI